MFGRARVDPAEPDRVIEFRRRVVQRLTSVSEKKCKNPRFPVRFAAEN